MFMHSPTCCPQAGTHVTLWLQSWHTHTRLQYALSFLLLGALAVAAEALSALRARCPPCAIIFPAAVCHTPLAGHDGSLVLADRCARRLRACQHTVSSFTAKLIWAMVSGWGVPAAARAAWGAAMPCGRTTRISASPAPPSRCWAS